MFENRHVIRSKDMEVRSRRLSMSCSPTRISLPQNGSETTENNLKTHRSRFFLAFLAYVSFIVLFIYFRTPIFTFLEYLGQKTRLLGFPGLIIVSLLVFLTAFPLVPGYGTLTTFCGYVYGFPYGLVPAILGALSGSVVCFTLVRKYASHRVKSWLKNYPWAKAILHSINARHNFRFLVLIRIAPYPFSLMNAFLSLCPRISLSEFALATLISLFKLASHVLVGAGLESLQIKGSLNMPWWEYVVVVLGMILGVSIAIYVYWVAKKIKRELNEDEELDLEESTDSFGEVRRNGFDLVPTDDIDMESLGGFPER